MFAFIEDWVRIRRPRSRFDAINEKKDSMVKESEIFQ